MKFTSMAIFGLCALFVPLCCYAKQPRNRVAMSTQKIHTHHIKKSHAGPYGFGGKLSKSRDHKYHPVKQHY